MKYSKTEITELKSQIFEHYGIRVFIKREDLNHPFVSGNKWWKLKYNLEKAIHSGYSTLLTFGGAYSNHIYATAAAARELGLKSIGIIRGEETLPLNPTLSFAQSQGMRLHYVSREEYRSKTERVFLDRLYHEFGDVYMIPEGGTNELAVMGCAEFANQLSTEIHFDYLCLPVGTGGTLAGMAEGINDAKKILGFPVLKGAAFLEAEIKRFTSKDNFHLIDDYHFGGYGKVTRPLMEFIHQFENNYQVLLDPVYTAKMMYGVMDLIKKNYFRPGSSILIVHTGGLQGRKGFSF